MRGASVMCTCDTAIAIGLVGFLHNSSLRYHASAYCKRTNQAAAVPQALQKQNRVAGRVTAAHSWCEGTDRAKMADIDLMPVINLAEDWVGFDGGVKLHEERDQNAGLAQTPLQHPSGHR